MLSLAGCAVNQATLVSIKAPFDTAEVKRLVGEGNNTIKGNALMRQSGGGVVTCAGFPVALTPVTAYSNERIFSLYQSNENGVNQGRNYKFSPDPPEYYSLARKTTCDAQGNFAFEHLPDGSFYITTVIAWMVGYNQQGGNMMQRVAVSGGKVVSVVMAP